MSEKKNRKEKKKDLPGSSPASSPQPTWPAQLTWSSLVVFPGHEHTAAAPACRNRRGGSLPAAPLPPSRRHARQETPHVSLPPPRPLVRPPRASSSTPEEPRRAPP